MHELSLITTIAASFAAAWVLGLLAQWLRLSPIVGYLLAGVLIGPYTPGFVGDIHLAHQLAEIGVILLMFGVGLHFHIRDLMAVKSVAIPGAIGQSLVATIAGIVLFTTLGMELKAGVVLGMATAVASTVVLIRVLTDGGVLDSPQGHIAVGWLLVEDVLTVIVLVLIPVLGGEVIEAASGAASHGAVGSPATLNVFREWEFAALEGLERLLGVEGLASSPLLKVVVALSKLAAVVALVMFAGSWAIPRALVHVARLRSPELFTLTVMVFSIAIAVGAYVAFEASMALGAFLAGMVVAQSPVSQQAAADALPLRDAFAVLFFVSTGMLFDPMFVIREPLMTLLGLTIILIAKPLAALIMVVVLGKSLHTALTVAVALAQIGEFSFILSKMAQSYGLLPVEGHHLLVGGAIISITLNPLLFRSIDRIERWIGRFPRLVALLNSRAEKEGASTNLEVGHLVGRSEHGRNLALIIGYGPVGRSVERLLHDAGLDTVIVDTNMDTVSEVTREGRQAILGDASRRTILELAGVRQASSLVLTLPQATHRTAIISLARSMNPRLKVFVRARYLREREELEQAGASAAIFEEAEAAVALARLVLAEAGANREEIDQAARDIRTRLILENVTAAETDSPDETQKSSRGSSPR